MNEAPPVPGRGTNYGTASETVQEALSEAKRRRLRRGSTQAVAHTRRPQDRTLRVPATGTQEQARKAPTRSLAGGSFLGDLKDHRLGIMILAGVLGLLVGLWALLSWEKPVTVEVTSREWSRVQEVEAYAAKVHARWCEDKAPDAYDVTVAQKQRGTRTVLDCRNCECHSERVRVGKSCREVNCRTVRTDNRDGTFEVSQVCDEQCDPKYETHTICEDRTHEEPVYASWCTYRVNRWQPQRSVSLEGSADKAPAWPSPVLNECESELGCERLGRRLATYRVFFYDLESGDTYECRYPEREWVLYEEGTQWASFVKMIGGHFQCEDLQWKAGGSLERDI